MAANSANFFQNVAGHVSCLLLAATNVRRGGKFLSRTAADFLSIVVA
jgi:hypothetical protein